MASILQIDGKWRALVRRKGHKQQCRTFRTKAAAETWARGVEADIDRGVTAQELSALTVADYIDAYEKMRDTSRPIADTSNEHYMLRCLRRRLGHLVAAKMSPDDLVLFASLRRDEDQAGPYTINMDVSKLGTVLRYGGAALRVTPPDIVGASRPTLTYLRLIGGGGKRERRPTGDELLRVLQHVEQRNGARFRAALEFAAFTAMRRGEVCALTMQDVNKETRVVSVLRKHPRKGKVLERVPLLGRAWDLLMSLETGEDGRFFPFAACTLSRYFTEACRELNIPDLHLHDLRHEGTSAMFEQGLEIQEVALVTGHKDWRNLRRYTNLRPEDLSRRDAERSAAAGAEQSSALVPKAG